MPEATNLTRAQAAALHDATESLDRVRSDQAVVDERRQKALADVARREQELTNLQGSDATPRQIEIAETKLAAAATASKEITSEIVSVDLEARRAREKIDKLVDRFKDPVAALEGSVPVALLPVRIETRFVGGELRVRIYPDVVHVDQLERLLTAEEEAYGHAYWSDRWKLTSSEDIRRCWERYVAGHQAYRFAWIVDRTAPVNADKMPAGKPEFARLTLRPAGPAHAPRARLLPGRWVVVGYRGSAEVLRKWGSFVPDPLSVGVAPGTAAGAPGDTATGPPADVQDELAIDEDARWLTDYDAAVAVGMAVTVAADDVDGGLAAGFDELVVVGVDHRRTPAEAAAELEATLEAHRFSTGLGFVGQGTPTNAGAHDVVDPRPAVLDPSLGVATSKASAASAVASKAFGLPANGTLARLVGSHAEPNRHTGDLHTAVWEATLGYFLRQIMAPAANDEQIAAAREHFRQHVRPRGPLPLLRVGRQPYGLLPVVAPQHFRGDSTEALLSTTLAMLRPMWAMPSRTARRLGDSGDPAADLVALLERTSRSVAFRIRQAVGPAVKANTAGGGWLSQFQQMVAQMVLGMMAVPGRPAIVDITLLDEQSVLPVPLVSGQTGGSNGLAPDYIRQVLERVSQRNAVSGLSRAAPQASTLLEALLIHSAKLELLRAVTGLTVEELGLDLPLYAALRDREIYLRSDRITGMSSGMTSSDSAAIGIHAAGTASAKLTVEPVELANRRLGSVSGRATIANFITSQSNADLQQYAGARQFAQFRASLDRLAGASSGELHSTTADALDALSHRYDAWATSMATRRLGMLRQRADAGIHVGGFGWVEQVRPASRRASHGYVHAPSIAHATTAAILRSGHLARSEGRAEPLSMDLSSRRVRDALKLIDGLRGGQSAAALLGYRFERALRDRGVEYARYILPSRRRHPLPETTDSGATNKPVEAIAARNVVDGLALGTLDESGRNDLLNDLKAQPAHRAALVQELDALADAIDAVGDLLVSESVFHAVLGNTERSAAALDALDRQVAIPEVGIAATPRTGTGLSHRVLLVFDAARPPEQWKGMADARSRAEPRVNAWAARVIGNPDRFRLAADVVDADGAVLQTVKVSLRDLGISALSVVLATTHGSEEVSELEERLAIEFAKRVTQDRAAGLRAHDGAAPGAPVGSAGLAELINTSRQLADLLSSARSATAADFAPGTESVEEVVEAGELKTRANTVRKALIKVAKTDVTKPSLTPAAMKSALRSAADLGLRGALPRSDERIELVEQLSVVVAEAQRRVAELDRLEKEFAAEHGTSAASPDAQARLHAERLRVVFGQNFPVVPRTRLPADFAKGIRASAADPALLAGDPLAPTEWVLRHSRVRPAVERLWSVLTGAERRGAGVDGTQFAVAQLPHRPGEPWIGRPLAAPGTVPTATLSLMLHRTAVEDDLPGTVAALVIDQWHERIPHPVETTGISFNFDSPGARPPQSILLATPPDADAERWSLDVLIDTVREAMDLTRMRTLDLDDLSGAGRFLPALYFAFNLEAEVPSLHVTQLIQQALTVWQEHEG